METPKGQCKQGDLSKFPLTCYIQFDITRLKMLVELKISRKSAKTSKGKIEVNYKP
jgi:hypothetical protein